MSSKFEPVTKDDARAEASSDSRAGTPSDSRAEASPDSRADTAAGSRADVPTDSPDEPSAGSRAGASADSRTEVPVGAHEDDPADSRAEVPADSRAGTPTDSPTGSRPDPRPDPRAGSRADGPELRAEGLRLAYDDRIVVEDLDLVIPTGRVTAIVGANACGKSTLLRALARLLTPKAGAVHLDGRSVHSIPTRTLAQQLGILPQTPVAPEGLTVIDLVGRGRSPHQTWWRQWSQGDEEAVHEALRATAMTDLAHRPVDELSGGQRQRAWIAMAVAQGTPVMLLDEPTTYLDLAHQIDVLDLVTDLNRHQGRTVVMVLHDLNQACRYADHIIAMKNGRVAGEGAPADVITATMVEDVFGLRCVVGEDPVSSTPMVIPMGRHHEGTDADSDPVPV